ncbi:hypothetical protein DN062_02860 [Nitrincola tibetensis]|uniref:Uncharacterized protein n=1 Tax=Nitrincola tibetensis TaxID=2219697 RepID=A0A364NQQ3_9GAMM|nr:hypothetical protein [Nitrincola tibetensis]RAU19225.1 hypothetical protein DN062_02860 [Nitrincola tibetensis]
MSHPLLKVTFAVCIALTLGLVVLAGFQWRTLHKMTLPEAHLPSFPKAVDLGLQITTLPSNNLTIRPLFWPHSESVTVEIEEVAVFLPEPEPLLTADFLNGFILRGVFQNAEDSGVIYEYEKTSGRLRVSERIEDWELLHVDEKGAMFSLILSPSDFSDPPLNHFIELPYFIGEGRLPAANVDPNQQILK